MSLLVCQTWKLLFPSSCVLWTKTVLLPVFWSLMPGDKIWMLCLPGLQRNNRTTWLKREFCCGIMTMKILIWYIYICLCIYIYIHACTQHSPSLSIHVHCNRLFLMKTWDPHLHWPPWAMFVEYMRWEGVVNSLLPNYILRGLRERSAALPWFFKSASPASFFLSSGLPIIAQGHQLHTYCLSIVSSNAS